eukprot:3235661-Pleurochrysis_carterae.AAC.1
MEVRTNAATTSASVAWDLRKHAIHADGSISGMGRSSVVRARPWTGVGDEDGVRARFAVHVGGEPTRMLSTLLTSTGVASDSILRNRLERIDSLRWFIVDRSKSPA